MYKKIVRGSNTYYVGQFDSYAVISNKLYYDGAASPDGVYNLNINDGSQITITVQGEIIV